MLNRLPCRARSLQLHGVNLLDRHIVAGFGTADKNVHWTSGTVAFAAYTTVESPRQDEKLQDVVGVITKGKPPYGLKGITQTKQDTLVVKGGIGTKTAEIKQVGS